MRIFQFFGRFFRRSAVEVTSQPDADMAALAEKLAAKRGENVNMGDAHGGSNPGERLADNARMGGIVTSSGEDDIVSG